MAAKNRYPVIFPALREFVRVFGNAADALREFLGDGKDNPDCAPAKSGTDSRLAMPLLRLTGAQARLRGCG